MNTFKEIGEGLALAIIVILITLASGILHSILMLLLLLGFLVKLVLIIKDRDWETLAKGFGKLILFIITTYILLLVFAR